MRTPPSARLRTTAIRHRASNRAGVLNSLLRRNGFATGVVAALALLMLAAGRLAADGRRPAPHPLYDIVAMGRSAGKIVLATPARPFEANQWRFRSLALLPAGTRPQTVVLSRSGTKVLASRLSRRRGTHR